LDRHGPKKTRRGLGPDRATVFTLRAGAARPKNLLGFADPNPFDTKQDGLGPGWPGTAQFPALSVTQRIRGAELRPSAPWRETRGRSRGQRGRRSVGRERSGWKTARIRAGAWPGRVNWSFRARGHGGILDGEKAVEPGPGGALGRATDTTGRVKIQARAGKTPLEEKQRSRA
jgi:hypothetical protein